MKKYLVESKRLVSLIYQTNKNNQKLNKMNTNYRLTFYTNQKVKLEVFTSTNYDIIEDVMLKYSQYYSHYKFEQKISNKWITIKKG